MQQYSLLNTSPMWENYFYLFCFRYSLDNEENVIKQIRCRSRCGLNLFSFVFWAHRFTIILFVILENFGPLCITSAGLKHWFLFLLYVSLVQLKLITCVDSCNCWKLILRTPRTAEIVRKHHSQEWGPILSFWWQHLHSGCLSSWWNVDLRAYLAEESPLLSQT